MIQNEICLPAFMTKKRTRSFCLSSLHCHCKHSLLTDPLKQFCVFRHYLAHHHATTCCLPYWETIIARWTIKAACCDECWLPKGSDILPDFTSELLTVPLSRPVWKILNKLILGVFHFFLGGEINFLKILKGKVFHFIVVYKVSN